MQRKVFERVKEGDPVSAKQYNELLEAVESMWGIMMTGGSMLEGPFGPVFVPAEDPQCQFLELNSDHAGIRHAESPDEVKFDDAVADGADPWADLGTDENLVCGSINSLWFQGERTMTMRHTPSGRHVMFPFTQWHLAVLDGALSNGGSATASVWWNPASGLSDSGKNVTVQDWLLRSGESIVAGTRIVIAQHRQSGNWYVIQAGCGAES